MRLHTCAVRVRAADASMHHLQCDILFIDLLGAAVARTFFFFSSSQMCYHNTWYEMGSHLRMLVHIHNLHTLLNTRSIMSFMCIRLKNRVLKLFNSHTVHEQQQRIRHSNGFKSGGSGGGVNGGGNGVPWHRSTVRPLDINDISANHNERTDGTSTPYRPDASSASSAAHATTMAAAVQMWGCLMAVRILMADNMLIIV